MWSLFTRAENHITVQLCVRLYVHALPCVLFIWSADTGCINLGCLRICGQTTPGYYVRKKAENKRGEHLSLPNVSTNVAAAADICENIAAKINFRYCRGHKSLVKNFVHIFDVTKYPCTGCCIIGELSTLTRGYFQISRR